jgi:hypothetical protein
VLGKKAAVLDRNSGASLRCSTSVGAWISGSSGRASISNSARAKACAARGLAALRISLANQRQNRWSPPRLGITRCAMASVPHT